MKTITIDPVWAWAIREGLKTVENRTWKTRHRGELAIHAGQGTPQREREARAQFDALGINVPQDLPRGAVVALATISDCLSIEELKRINPSLAFSPFCTGPICWLLNNILPLQTPIPGPGKQGLWDWEFSHPLDRTANQ